MAYVPASPAASGHVISPTALQVPTSVLTRFVIEVTFVGNPAENGILAFLSPDMQKRLKSTMDSDCVTGMGSSCYEEVLDVLDSSDRTLQARILATTHEARSLGL